ncbi:MAG: ubiquitin-like domain-containing protein, partial [Brooklawnia sp.]
MKKPVVATIAGAVALVSIGAGGFASAMDKAITLRVDGQTQQVHVWGSTVEDALAAHSLELTPRDEVSPTTDTPIADGSIVDVRFARPVTVIVDGELKSFWTTATTLDQALA